MKYQSKKNPTAIFFSNPFGYGPTGTAIAIMKEFIKKWSGEIIYASSSLCREPFCQITLRNKKIKVVNLDERNPALITNLLKNVFNPYVISILNRFAVHVSSSLKIPNVFIDTLTWFWKKIPDEYLLADYYFCPNLPGSERTIKDAPCLSKIIPVPAILGKLPKIKRKKDNFILIQIGGCFNPLQPGLPIAYLELLAEALNRQNLSQKILIAGGHKALKFLEKNLNKKNILCHSLPRKDFLEILSKTNQFITTAGESATLEAFALKVPTSFLPPTNLSQWTLLNLLIDHQAAPKKVLLEEFITPDIDFNNLKEKDALILFSKYYNRVLENATLRDKYIERLLYLLREIPVTKNQELFIDKIGVDGAKIIVDKLKKIWSF